MSVSVCVCVCCVCVCVCVRVRVCVCVCEGYNPHNSSTHSRVLVFIDHCVVDDAFCSVSISQSRQALLIIIRRWAHRGNHDCLAVATQVILWAESQSHCYYLQ